MKLFGEFRCKVLSQLNSKFSALLGAVSACTSRCQCESGFSLARGVTTNSTSTGPVEYCMIKMDSALTYSAAKETCQDINTQLPRVNSEDELVAWSDITEDRLVNFKVDEIFYK